MSQVPLWRVYAEVPVPTIRPHDHHATLHQALTAQDTVISAETIIGGRPRKHHVAATITLAAIDEAAALRLARHAIQHACATARLPTGPIRTLTTQRLDHQAP